MPERYVGDGALDNLERRFRGDEYATSVMGHRAEAVLSLIAEVRRLRKVESAALALVNKIRSGDFSDTVVDIEVDALAELLEIKP